MSQAPVVTPTTGNCGCVLIQWKIVALVHHWLTRLALLMEEVMLENARGKEKRLDGLQCLKRKRMKEIKNVEKHTKEKRSNTCISKVPLENTRGKEKRLDGLLCPVSR